MSKEKLGAWGKLFGLNEDKSAQDLVSMNLAAGDSVMSKIWKYVKSDDGRVDEQMDRDNGNQKSAKGLTWSYANILHAMYIRKSIASKSKLMSYDGN